MKLKVAPENFLERMALALNLAPLPLIDTQIVFTTARAIMAAAELGIFESIGKGNHTAEEIAKKSNTHPAATRQLLDCLTGIGYLKWSDGRYSMKPKYHKWLLKESPSNLIGKLRFQISEWNWMASLEEYVRSGKPMELHSVISESEWGKYQDGMRDLSVNTAKELGGKLKLPDGATKMLDIGGSHGLFSIELCRKNPSLSSTILELPGAITRAKEIASSYDDTGRISYKPGNALTDELGENEYDVVMINNVVHHFTPEENFRLAEKVARALEPGGMYAVGEFIRNNRPGKGDVVGSSTGLYFSLISESGTWSEEEISSWQTKAGLKSQKPVTLMSLPGWKMIRAVK